MLSYKSKIFKCEFVFVYGANPHNEILFVHVHVINKDLAPLYGTCQNDISLKMNVMKLHF